MLGMIESLSVSFRLQRITLEEAHVSVLVTPEMWIPNPHNSAEQKLDVEKLVEIAIQQGSLPATTWKLECPPVIKQHPVQTAPD
jgi:hypothetical protein